MSDSAMKSQGKQRKQEEQPIKERWQMDTIWNGILRIDGLTI